MAGAGGGTNAMGVFKSVRAWRFERCPARPKALGPGRGQLFLDI
jgi:hypothetical protein